VAACFEHSQEHSGATRTRDKISFCVNRHATDLFHPSQFRLRVVYIGRRKGRSSSNIRRIQEDRCKSRHDNGGGKNSENRETLQNSSRSWRVGCTTDLFKFSRFLRTDSTTRETSRLSLQSEADKIFWRGLARYATRGRKRQSVSATYGRSRSPKRCSCHLDRSIIQCLNGMVFNFYRNSHTVS